MCIPNRYINNMPANLTPQYRKIEDEYRRATSIDEELQCLQRMLQEIPKHKGTDHLQAELKAKISKAKKEMATEKSSGKKTRGLRIPRQGAGTVDYSWRAECGQEPTCGPAYQRHARSGSISLYNHGARPGNDGLGRRYRSTHRYATHHGRFHGSQPSRTDSSCRSGPAIGRPGQRRLHRAVPGRFRSTCAQKTRLAARSYLDEQDVGLSYTQTFLTPNKIDAPGAAERWICSTNYCPWTFPNT